MATKRLIGKDGKVAKGVKGALITGNGSTALATGFYITKNVLSTGSGLPDTITSGFIFYASAVTGKTITPATAETVIPLTLTDLCDIKSASLEFTKEEVDVTTLCDDLKTYRAGFSDASGTLEGITTIGVSESIIGKFIPTIVQSVDLQDVVITDVDGDTLYLQVEVNQTSTAGENTAFYIAPVTLLSYSASAAVDGEQAFTSNFRITQDDDVKACFYEQEQA